MVGTICAVRGCKKESYPGCGISFHKLPSDVEDRKKWFEATPGKINSNSVICSCHFKPDDYRTMARKRLKQGVIPSIFPKTSSEQGPSWKRLRRSSSGESVKYFSEDEEDPLDGSDDSTTQYVNAHDQCLEISEVETSAGYKCNVCSADIKGFRYSCVQCADWDMCAACDARGEHPHHYVLRLPAPATHVDSKEVLAAIRKHIAALMDMKKEWDETEITVKEESTAEEPENYSTNSPSSNYQSVPEVTVPQQDAKQCVYFISNPPASSQNLLYTTSRGHPVRSEVSQTRHPASDASVPLLLIQNGEVKTIVRRPANEVTVPVKKSENT